MPGCWRCPDWKRSARSTRDGPRSRRSTTGVGGGWSPCSTARHRSRCRPAAGSAAQGAALGIFAFLLDMAHLYAVVSTLPADGACTTAELSVTVLGEPPPSGAEITGRSRVIYSDERNALAEGLVVDQGGQPLAHSTSRCFLFAPGAVVPRSGADRRPGCGPREPGPCCENPCRRSPRSAPRCSSG